MSAHDPKHDQNPGYETTDADVPAIFKYGIAMFITIFISLVLMWALHYGFQNMPYEEGREPSPMEKEHMLPPRPHLQIDSALDLAALRAEEDRKLHSYGWVRKEAGAVRIPIEKAMEMILQKGIPATPVPKPAARAAETKR